MTTHLLFDIGTVVVVKSTSASTAAIFPGNFPRGVSGVKGRPELSWWTMTLARTALSVSKTPEQTPTQT